MSDILNKIVSVKRTEVQAAQDVIEGFSAHIRAENLTPARFQFAVAAFAQEGEGAQLLLCFGNVPLQSLRCAVQARIGVRLAHHDRSCGAKRAQQ